MTFGVLELLPWLVLAAAMLVMLLRFGALTTESLVGAFGAALLWFGLYWWTGDRRFFFPYAMQFAVQAAILLAGNIERPVLLGGGGFVVIFAAIRVFQGATAFVLFVELLVATFILLATAYALRRVSRDTATRAIAGATGSLAAYFGLLVN